MESNLLSSAKQYQKAHKWDKAIDCYEEYIKKSNRKLNDDTYVSYAKCLRVVGRGDHAEKLLMDGRNLHPQSERIVRELHNLYDSLGDWNSAKAVANTLVEMDPKQANYHFRLGRTYAYLNEFQKAKKVYKTGLKYKHEMSLEKLIEKIQKGFTDNPSEVSSEYIFINGRNNLGAFIHEYGDKRYFTKISRYTRGARREKTFYKKLCTEFPILNETVPLYVDSQVLDRVIYLTMEMIDDVQTTSEHINEVIETSQKIKSIKYNELIKTYPNPKYLFILRNRPISIVIFFTKIHERFYNERLFSSLYRFAKQHNHPKSVSQVIIRLESLIMRNHLYAFIEREEHYGLLHGDFIPQNIKIQKSNGMPQVFDWATFTVGPHFIDIARYLTTTFTPYSKVKEIYLFNDRTGGKLSLIEKIFFLYASILFYLLTSRRKSIETRLNEYILPALNDLEILVTEFKKNEFEEALQSLLEKKEEYKHNAQQLEKQALKLKREKVKVQNKFQDLINSKSWKITAPLRNFVEMFHRR